VDLKFWTYVRIIEWQRNIPVMVFTAERTWKGFSEFGGRGFGYLPPPPIDFPVRWTPSRGNFYSKWDLERTSGAFGVERSRYLPVWIFTTRYESTIDAAFFRYLDSVQHFCDFLQLPSTNCHNIYYRQRQYWTLPLQK